MAINYEPVGWDTTKYVNPTNMNHMDDGIKAACDGVDAANKSLENLDKSTKSAQYGSCNNTDLNTIKTPGIYFCDSSSKASTDNNFPDAIKGYLIVYAASESAVQQIYYANKNYVYTRTYWDGGWGSWNKQVLNSDLDKQLSEKKIFFGLDSVGMSLTNTLQEVYNAMPDNSMLKVFVSNGSERVVFQQSLPVYSAGEVIIYRGTSARGYIQFLQDNNGDMWRNNYYNSALQGWDRFVLNSNFKKAESTTIVSSDASVVLTSGVTNDYTIKNGWCFVRVDMTIADTNKHVPFVLPKPALSYYTYFADQYGGSGILRLGSDGNCRVSVETGNERAYFVFSYPIAE